MSELSIPPSPTYQAIINMFTTLNDDDLPNIRHLPPHNHQDLSVSELLQEPQLHRANSHTPPCDLEVDADVQPCAGPLEAPRGMKAKSKRKLKVQEYVFCSLTGKDVKKGRKRSAFANARRMEVLHIRDLGACLRCRIRKIPVSRPSPICLKI